MTRAVLFDLGNTLAAYYQRTQFRRILERAMSEVLAELTSRNARRRSDGDVMQRALAENRESADHRVNPLAQRLERILGLRLEDDPQLADALCRRFLAPIFALGRVYDDTFPVLERLRSAGMRIAIVSNTPWGSDPRLWREELGRLGLAELVDCAVFCGDVGWRKPASVIFEHAAARLGVRPGLCTFVGDEPAWDIQGSIAAGMNAILIDRDNRHRDSREHRVEDLWSALASFDFGTQGGQ